MQLKKNNQAALILVKNAYIHERLKYIDITYYYVRNLYMRNRINIFFIFSRNIIADGLTKPLLKQNFPRFIGQLELRGSLN